MRILVIQLLMFIIVSACVAQSPENYRLLGSQGPVVFVKELNENGELGFRLAKVTAMLNDSRSFKDINLVAVLERSPGQSYEYDWFEAYSPLELEQKINDRAKSGFHFKAAIPFAENYCGIASSTAVRPDATPIERSEALLTDVLNRVKVANAISYGGIFVVERKIGNEMKNYRIAADTVASDTLGLKGTSEELLKHHLDVLVREGFRPVTMMSLRQLNRISTVVLLEDDPNKREMDFEAVIARSGFEKKVNRLAKNGYELLFSGGNGIEKYALLRKINNVPASYRWVNVHSKKEFSSQSALAFREGAFQFVSYSIQGCDLLTTHLAFRNVHSTGVRGTETKLLSLHDAAVISNRQKADPLKISDGTKSKFMEVTDQGFKVRDMFYANGVYLIMERAAQ